MTAAEFLAESKRIEEALKHPAFPLDYAGQGWLRRADKGGDEVDTFITIPSGEYLDNGMYEGDWLGLAVAESLSHARTVLPRMREALEAVLAVHDPIPAVDYGVRDRPLRTQVCTGCGQDDGNWQYWPCPTVRAIESALAENGGTDV